MLTSCARPTAFFVVGTRFLILRNDGLTYSCSFVTSFHSGSLRIAEVVSRIEDLDAFIAFVEGSGFSITQRDQSNNVFVRIDFEKTAGKFGAGPPAPQLKPCVYKKR